MYVTYLDSACCSWLDVAFEIPERRIQGPEIHSTLNQILGNEIEMLYATPRIAMPVNHFTLLECAVCRQRDAHPIQN